MIETKANARYQKATKTKGRKGGNDENKERERGDNEENK